MDHGSPVFVDHESSVNQRRHGPLQHRDGSLTRRRTSGSQSRLYARNRHFDIGYARRRLANLVIRNKLELKTGKLSAG